jgi:4-amino-4-deoxy-L-arabinose transferase-like glycosyltransferase
MKSGDISETRSETNTQQTNSNASLAKMSLPTWYKLALVAVILLGLFLDFFQLDQQGYGNLYYAAAVKSMLLNWHNFFFVSFDPAGFVTVDKPPLGFWIQVLSAKLFGFSPLSLMLPQALAGVLSVALLTHLVRRTFGPLAGLIAGLTLALTPISVVTNRNNIVDSLLVLTVLLAAWAIIIATETGRLRWLLLCAGIVGLGFNIKMLEAYLVLPAFALLYLLAAPLRWRTKIAHLAFAAVVLLIISLSWLVTVDLIPAFQRPYVGSSGNNSEISLAFGYNGLARIFGFTGLRSTFSLQSQSQSALTSLQNMVGPSETGSPSPVRLLNDQLGGQISWLLPLAVLGILGLAWQKRPKMPLDKSQQGLILWSVWFLTQAIFFSVAEFFHLYYMVMLAPSLCALTGIGIATMWQDYKQGSWRRWLLPIAFLVTAAVQIRLLFAFPEWSLWLTPIILVISLIVVAILLVARFLTQNRLKRILGPLAALGFIALLLAPATWSAVSVAQNYSNPFPIAGPEPQQTPLAKLITEYDNAVSHPDPALSNYLAAHQGNARYIVATSDAITAAFIIIQTGKPVMAYGGFEGLDHIVTLERMIDLIHQGQVRYVLSRQRISLTNAPLQLQLYFLESSLAVSESGITGQYDITNWLVLTCVPVSPSHWQSASSRANTSWATSDDLLVLYDCQGIPGTSQHATPGSNTLAAIAY